MQSGLGFFRKKILSSRASEETGRNLEETGRIWKKRKKVGKKLLIPT
jgi:hypothetical protein